MHVSCPMYLTILYFISLIKLVITSYKMNAYCYRKNKSSLGQEGSKKNHEITSSYPVPIHVAYC